MVLCPSFWDKVALGQLPHLYDRVQGSRTTNLRSVITQEHVILHELMHAVDTFFVGVDRKSIIDVATVLPGETDDPNIPPSISKVKVYGPTRCKKLAASKSPSTLVRINADNYAWFATSYFFSKNWGIGVSTSEVVDVTPVDSIDYADDVSYCEEDPDSDSLVCVL
jgi:hypothetical protein